VKVGQIMIQRLNQENEDMEEETLRVGKLLNQKVEIYNQTISKIQ